ncbi:hypothetical protein [Herbiconiux sp. UC225_62]|uniref:hypothetical protein n=1 Tax=Herbiconiux sp. UC225_62 TaxID=3350168 RepID=UPI0036D219D4
MNMQLRHYTSAPLVFERFWTYEQRKPMTHSKPRGFWVSVQGEDDWPSWCKSEGWGTERLVFEHEVTLVADANVLVIDSLDALVAFEAEWGIREEKSFTSPSRAFEHSWVDVSINWPAFAARFSGIIIAPYQWQARLNHDWYYGWDVASGCIWDLSVIASVTVIEDQPAVAS